MTKKKLDKFMLDLIRVCAKHKLALTSSDGSLAVQKITAKAVQNIKDAKVDVEGYIEEEEQKNPKKKYKFYKPDENKSE